MDKIYKEVHDYKLKLAIEGPPILNDSPFLLDEVNEYNKGEFGKKYGYGNYQDKGLPKNKKINMSPQSYVKRKNSTIVDINEYLRNLRKGVDR